MSPSRRLVLLAIVVGVGLGVFSMLADGVVGGRLFGILGNIASPWGLAAFLVGRRATSPKMGALVGALTLVVGVATYYLGASIRDYAVGDADLVWTAVALVAGPVMGWSGAAVATQPARAPVVAVAAPSAMLVAEAMFLAIDRRIWASNFGAEPYRLIDVGVILALLLGGLALPAWFEKDRSRRRVVYLVVLPAGVFGALGFTLLRRILTGLA